MTAVPSAVGTTLTIAALTLRRLSRGRLWIVGTLVASLPILFAFLLRSQERYGEMYDDLLFIEELLMALVPAMFVASAIGDDIEDRTMTYLWSRPVPRIAVLAGKLVALVPIVCALLVVPWILAITVATDMPPPFLTVFAMFAGGVAVSATAAGIATLVPRHGMALTVVYMLFFDLPIGFLPASLRRLALSHHVRQISEIRLDGGIMIDSPSVATATLAVIAAVWLAVAVWRFRRLEA